MITGHEHLWLSLGVLATMPPAILFPLMYATLSPRWWRSTIGRAMMILSLGLASLVAAGVVRLFLGNDNYFFLTMRVAIYTVLPFGMWYLLYSYVKTLRKAYLKGHPIPPVPADLHIGDEDEVSDRV